MLASVKTTIKLYKFVPVGFTLNCQSFLYYYICKLNLKIPCSMELALLHNLISSQTSCWVWAVDCTRAWGEERLSVGSERWSARGGSAPVTSTLSAGMWGQSFPIMILPASTPPDKWVCVTWGCRGRELEMLVSLTSKPLIHCNVMQRLIVELCNKC